MSLLDTASLIVTPNAYKEGKLYSVVPSDGSGDLSVTRATTATRVNSAGLVELVPYNLLTYSERFENAAWVNVNSSEVANATTAPNGTLTADNLIPSATTAQHGTLQAVTLNALSQYTYSIYFKPNGYTAAILRLTGSSIWGPTDGIVVSFETATMTTTLISGTPTTTFTSVGDGWYRCSVTATTIASGSSNAVVYAKEYSPYLGNGTSGIYLWGAQLNEGTLKDYFATETRLNIPRLDYSLGSCPSILVEPQRTNLALRSEEFDNAYWGKLDATISVNSTTAPNGILTADKLVPNTNNANHGFALIPTLTSGQAYTFSLYVKAAEYSRFVLQLDANSNTATSTFNLNDGSVTTAFGTATITSAANGWYRVSVTGTLLTTGPFIRFRILDNSGNLTFIGNGTSGLFIWGAQLEAGAYATSYIPTTSASVTRNNEIYNKTSISSLIGQTEGTMFVNIYDYNFTPNNTSPYFEIYADANNRIIIFKNTSNQYQLVIRNGGVTTLSIVTASISGNSKIAIGYKENDCVVYVNGVQVGIDTSVTIPTCSAVYLGSSITGVFVQKDVFNVAALWKERFTNAELAALTTL